MKMDECTCEVDHEEKFVCDFCLEEAKAESEWFKNSVVDEYGERFTDQNEMDRIYAYRSITDLENYFAVKLISNWMSQKQYDKVMEDLFNIRTIILLTEIMKGANNAG